MEENSLFSQIIHTANGSKIASPKPHEGGKVDKYASAKRALIVKIELFIIFRYWR